MYLHSAFAWTSVYVVRIHVCMQLWSTRFIYMNIYIVCLRVHLNIICVHICTYILSNRITYMYVHCAFACTSVYIVRMHVRNTHCQTALRTYLFFLYICVHGAYACMYIPITWYFQTTQTIFMFVMPPHLKSCVWFSVLQHVAVRCSVLQHVAACCIVLQPVRRLPPPPPSPLFFPPFPSPPPPPPLLPSLLHALPLSFSFIHFSLPIH